MGAGKPDPQVIGEEVEFLHSWPLLKRLGLDALVSFYLESHLLNSNLDSECPNGKHSNLDSESECPGQELNPRNRVAQSKEQSIMLSAAFLPP
jgi:hypothetical protein